MGAESYNRQFTADPVQSFYIQGSNSFCPQDPTSPNAIATAQFCDFTDPGSRYRYNRASLNAQSSYLLENFARHRRLSVRSRKRRDSFSCTRSRSPQQSGRLSRFPVFAPPSRFVEFRRPRRSQRLFRHARRPSRRRLSRSTAGPRFLGGNPPSRLLWTGHQGAAFRPDFRRCLRRHRQSQSQT